MPTGQTESAAVTLPFETFWSWLQSHANCILRAGTPEALLFDHDDYHWHLAAEDDHVLVVQLIRGKEMVGELVVFPSEIAYVQCEPAEPGGGDEYVFECIVEGETTRQIAYHFVLAHAYDEYEPPSRRSWTH